MNIQKLFLFISMFYIMNLFSGTCRPLGVPNHSFQLHHKILSQQKGEKSMVVAAGAGEDEESSKEYYYKEMKKMIGSRPPSCENKCFGCMPCEPIQVPTTTGSSTGSTTVGVQYANYLPEGWKCKCGPTLYAP